MYNRISIFEDHLIRDMKAGKFSSSTSLCLVTHGLTMRVFLMRWFNWTVESFLQVSAAGFRVLTAPSSCVYSSSWVWFVQSHWSPLLKCIGVEESTIVNLPWIRGEQKSGREKEGLWPATAPEERCSRRPHTLFLLAI